MLADDDSCRGVLGACISQRFYLFMAYGVDSTCMTAYTYYYCIHKQPNMIRGPEASWSFRPWCAHHPSPSKWANRHVDSLPEPFERLQPEKYKIKFEIRMIARSALLLDRCIWRPQTGLIPVLFRCFLVSFEFLFGPPFVQHDESKSKESTSIGS